MKFGNKSLFLYTGLIFLVALIIIIITFFGQDRILRETNEQIETATAGITERAAILSDENMKLTEKVNELNAKIDSLSKELENLSRTNDDYETLFQCYGLIYTGDFFKANEILNSISKELLSENAMKLYDDLNGVLLLQDFPRDPQEGDASPEVAPSDDTLDNIQ